jgi:hypothetical protein
MSWVAPDSCTLPTVEQPLRVAEFDALFAAVRAVEQVEAIRLRLALDGGPEVEKTARDLAGRETSCCSFFTFSFTRTDDGGPHMEISVPDAHTDVLSALGDRARAVSGTPR